MERIIERTDDGSATLFVPELNEHYHSTKGARTESQHIFIDMGLKASPAATPRVLEIGFGTGLNAWLTLEEAERSRRNIHYTGLELYPLDWQTVEQLGISPAMSSLPYIEYKQQPTSNLPRMKKNNNRLSNCLSSFIHRLGKRHAAYTALHLTKNRNGRE